MDSVYTSSTENDETPMRYNITPVSLRPTMPTDLFLTLASNNANVISLFISKVKGVCSEFIAGVYELIGEVSEDSEYYESDVDDDEYDEDDSDDCSEDDFDDDVLTRKIVANEFETIISDLRNKLDILEKAYLSAKDTFNSSMSEEIKAFLQP